MDNNHPIQLLWKRNDTLAQIELYSLGNSLRIIKNNDSDWINGKIKRIKNRDIGAIFEILAAAMFEQGKNHEVFLPPLETIQALISQCFLKIILK